jgi:vacuolar protein sorting-associated protein 54
LTNIPHVEASEFRSYLTQIGSLYDALQRAKESEDENGTQFFRRGSKQDDFADLIDQSLNKFGNRPHLSRNASLASLRSLSPIEPPQPRRRSSGGGKRIAHAPTPLSTVPSVYFEPDFHLENPRTFDVVSERSEVVKPAPGTPDAKVTNGAAQAPRKALATNAILQEKLSWYMDTIEIHLINSISTASSSFFAALGSLRELHTEAAASVERIKGLREELEALDKDTAMGGLEIVHKRRRRENLKQLGDAVQQLRRIVDGVQQCETLVDNGNIEKALDAIDGLERLIAGEEVAITDVADGTLTIRDLRGVNALQGVSGDLDTLRYRIGKAYESRFLSALLGDLRGHIGSVSTAEILQRWNNASQRSRGTHSRETSSLPTYLNITDDFRSEMLSNLKGLYRSKHTSPATTAYRDSVLREVKSIIRRPLPSSNDDDNDSMMSASTVGGRQLSQQEKSSILARNLRNLEPEEAEELLVKIYIGVGETLRRLGTQVKVLLDVTSSLEDPAGASGLRSPPRSPNIMALDGRMSGASSYNAARQVQEDMHHTLDMSNLMGQAVDMAQNQIVKVLRVRSEQSIHQPLPRFLRYFTLNLLFANECEAVSGRSGTALKTVVNGHIKDFIQQLGDSERQKLAQGMEADQWNARDFAEQDESALSRILDSSTQDAEDWAITSKIWLPYSDLPSTSSAPTNGTPAPPTNGTKQQTRTAKIDDESFILPASATLCLHGLDTFLHLITNIPSLTAEISTSLLEYLKLFNSRCTQLILGAGATRSAGLKNITTKHLALASQALSFVTALIPHVREFVRRHGGTGSLMGEFDKVKRLFQEHQNSIYDKLVDIMSGRATTHVKAMRQIKWDEEGSGVNGYMETLVKETSTLHRVLSKHLSEGTVLGIMEPVFKNYREQWGRAFEEVDVKTEKGRDRYIYPF